MTLEVIAGIDLGGTNCKIGIFDPQGQLLKSWKISSKNFVQPEDVVPAIATELKRFEEFKDLKAIGVGVPGLIDSNGIIIESPNFPVWKNLKLKELLEGEFHLPIAVENDANLFSVGEGFAGAAKEFESYIGITLGTGVGGGIVLNGKIFRGAKGMAGEIGHTVIHPSGPLCGCGKKGCLEAYSSGTAIKREMQKATGLELEPMEIYGLAKKGDKAAVKVFEKASYHLGIGISNIVNILDIPAVIIGGGVSEAWDLIINPLKKGFKEHTFQIHFDTVEIRKSQLGDLAGIYGAFRITQPASSAE
jgi:glucokinase